MWEICVKCKKIAGNLRKYGKKIWENIMGNVEIWREIRYMAGNMGYVEIWREIRKYG